VTNIFDDMEFEEFRARMHREVDKLQKEVDAATANGREVQVLLAGPETQPGDILSNVLRVQPSDNPQEDDEYDEENPLECRVIAVNPISLYNKETEELCNMVEALVVVLEDGDLMGEDEFAALYGGEENAEKGTDGQVQEAPKVSGEEVPEQRLPELPEDLAGLSLAEWRESIRTSDQTPEVDPNTCECGASRRSCERNQEMFGVHVNE
jgi:hypothetical protein